MTHARKQLRDQAVAAIQGLATTGSNVFVGRVFALTQQQLPAWVVGYDEAAEEIDFGRQGGYERQLQLQFVGMARARDGAALHDELDTMCEELETAVTSATFPDAQRAELVAVEFEFEDEDVDSAMGAAILTYSVTYYTAPGAPGTIV